MSRTNFKLIFSHSSGFVSALVRFFLRSKHLSHCVGNFKIFSADVIMESSEKGVEINTAKHFAGANSIQAIVRPISGSLLTDDGAAQHLSWLIESYEGTSYDWLAAGSIGIMDRMKWLWNLVGGWLTKHLKANVVHCTELWIRFINHAGYKAGKGLNTDLSGPPVLLKALAAHPEEFQIEFITPGLKEELGL